ncbi:MAG: tetratricopeptide repeat protein [bacterium]|nr:tetratricopeptide repeat protein [bacterium]
MHPFYNRETQQTDLKTQLGMQKSIIGIYGREGMGKTALMDKFLADIRHDTTIAGVVYLHADSRPLLTSGTIFEALASFLPDNHPFHETFTNAQVSTQNKTRELLQSLQSGRYVLLIDNLDTIQESDLHYLIDDSIRHFLETLLEKGDEQSLTVIITSRYPLPFSDTRPLSFPLSYQHHHHAILLTDGLPIEDALRFMHDMDVRKFLPTIKGDLKVWWHKVQGIPRGLEALIQYLYKQQSHDIEDLFNTPDLFKGHVVMNLVEKVHQSLPHILEQILQAVAVIGQHCTQAELTHVIAPYVDTIHLPMLLNDLVERRLLKYDAPHKTYSLPTLDRIYLQKNIAVGSADDIPKPDPLIAFYRKVGKTPPPEIANKRDILPFTHYVITHRIAEFYRQQSKPVNEWHTIADIQAQLREIDYRMALGDYDSATHIVIDIGFDYLLKWGYVELLMRLYTNLEGKIKNPSHALTIMNNLGDIYKQMENHDTSRQKYQTALEMAQAQGNRVVEARLLGAIGLSYTEVGQYQSSQAYYEKGLAISIEIDDKSLQMRMCGNLGNVFTALGQLEPAILYTEEAIRISHEIGDEMREGILLHNIAIIYETLGNLEKAVDYTRQALNLSHKTNDSEGNGINLGSLGENLALMGRYQDAIFNLGESIKIFKQLKLFGLAQWRLYTLASVYWRMGDMSNAVKTIEETKLYDIPSDEAQGLHLIEGCIRYCAGDMVQARQSFENEIAISTVSLAESPNRYQVMYARAHAYVGLWCITGEMRHYTEALIGYKNGLSILDSSGVRHREHQIVQTLLACATNREGSEFLDLLMRG